MAVTKIWPVRDRFDKVLDYAANAKKTAANIEKYHALDGVIDYAADSDKTEKCFYVSGVNCLPENAKETFAATQKRYGKTTGKVAYHMYQSFAEGEVDADTAHKIGVKLAEEVFGDRFEALVATHLNTDHFHNHIVINAVSWKDGLRYNDCKATYTKIREVSDRLCREYGLSVIEHPKGRGVNYGEWKADNVDETPTRRSLIRGAINTAIGLSITMAQFVEWMKELGFIIDESGKHAKIKNVGDRRFVRFDSLGVGFSVKEIRERICAQNKPKYSGFPKQDDPEDLFDGKEPVEIMRFVPMYVSYQRALERAEKRPAHNIRMYYLIRRDTSHKRLYEDTVGLLCMHRLNSAQDVIDYQKEAMRQIDENYAARKKMYALLKRAQERRDLAEVGKIRYNIGIYSLRLSRLRREVTTCDEVLERSGMIRDNLKRIREENYRGTHITRKTKNKDKERYND